MRNTRGKKPIRETAIRNRSLTFLHNEHMFTNDFVDKQERGFTVPRPFCPRRIACWPEATYFKPAGVPLRVLAEVTLKLDELEALRLADLNGMYQEQAAQRMKISRPTFARIVEAARRKVADVLVNGKALRVEGGPVVPGNPQQRTSSGPGLGGGLRPCHGRNRSDRTK